MDSELAATPGVAPRDVRRIAQRFLEACYSDLGKAPRYLDGDDLAVVMRELLPRRFGVKDPLATHVEAVVRGYLVFLVEEVLVPNAFELGKTLDEGSQEFAAAIAAGPRIRAATLPIPVHRSACIAARSRSQRSVSVRKRQEVQEVLQADRRAMTSFRPRKVTR